MGCRHTVLSILALTVLAVAVPVAAQTPELPGQPADPLDFDIGNIVSQFGIEIAVGLGLAGLAGLGLFFGLGTRHVTAENALDNETRAEMYDVIQDDPGIHLRELARNQDVNITAASWHLKKLEDVGLIRSRKTEGYKVFYTSEGGREAQELGLARSALNNDNAYRILERVGDEPGAHQRGLADALELNHATVRWHLDKLAKADLVVKVPTGYRTRYFLSAPGLHAMQTLDPPHAS